jgi:hypothetical protein
VVLAGERRLELGITEGRSVGWNGADQTAAVPLIEIFQDIPPKLPWARRPPNIGFNCSLGGSKVPLASRWATPALRLVRLIRPDLLSAGGGGPFPGRFGVA